MNITVRICLARSTFLRWTGLVLLWAATGHAAIGQSPQDLVRPNEVAIIAAQGNDDSTELAAFYCEKRGVAKERVITLDFPEGEILDRTAWEEKIRPQISQWIEANDPSHEIRYFVTLFGTPLAISQWPTGSPEIVQWKKFYERAKTLRIARINTSLKALCASTEVDFQPLAEDASLERRGEFFDDVAGRCQQAISQLSVDKQKAANDLLQQQVRTIAGLDPFLKGMNTELESAPGQNPELAGQFERAVGFRQGILATLQALNETPASLDRDAAIMLCVEQNDGILGALIWIEAQSEMINKNESMASFDSELSLVRWTDYRRIGTVINYASDEYSDSELSVIHPTYTVTRIDAPTLEIAKGLVDKAIEREKDTGNGSRPGGNIYVDRRGLVDGEKQEMQIESWLTSVAERFQDQEGYTVTRDDSPRLFGVGSCPDTTLYLGWYGLGNFTDSFTFRPGAVAYHLTPGDALGIHDSADTGWCTGLLKKGATSVIGSTSQPELIKINLSRQQAIIVPRRTVLSGGTVIFADFNYTNRP